MDGASPARGFVGNIVTGVGVWGRGGADTPPNGLLRSPRWLKRRLGGRGLRSFVLLRRRGGPGAKVTAGWKTAGPPFTLQGPCNVRDGVHGHLGPRDPTPQGVSTVGTSPPIGVPLPPRWDLPHHWGSPAHRGRALLSARRGFVPTPPPHVLPPPGRPPGFLPAP